MADIKTRDAVKGTIKTIDKAAIATNLLPPVQAAMLKSRSFNLLSKAWINSGK